MSVTTGSTLNDDLEAVLERMTEDQLRRTVQLYLDEVGYLGDHDPPEGDEKYGKFPCTGQTWHRCSGGNEHDPRCRAVGGKGLRRRNRQVSCAKTCEAGPPEAWCQNSGFDCWTCKFILDVREVIAEVGTTREEA